MECYGPVDVGVKRTAERPVTVPHRATAAAVRLDGSWRCRVCSKARRHGLSLLGEHLFLPKLNSHGCEIYFEVTGTGFPIIFSHKFSSDMRAWEPQVRDFARKVPSHNLQLSCVKCS